MLRRLAKRWDRPGRAKLGRRKLCLERLEPRVVLDAGPLLINELMAVNDDVLADEDGDFPDWIEIHNPTDTAVGLDGWHLTDDDAEPDKLTFPDDPSTTVELACSEDRFRLAA